MLMRCLDDLIRHVVIGWQVSDIDFKSRGVRRRRRNYFMGGGAHAPRCVKDIAFKSRNYFMGPGAARTHRGAPWHVKDIAFKSRNCFMGPGGGAHAPWCAAAR